MASFSSNLPHENLQTGSTKAHKTSRSSVRENGNMILRGLGLGVLVGLLRRWPRSRAQEPLKIVLRENRTVAILRSLIHVIPAGLSLWLVTLNIVTYYVGSFTLAQVYYQVGAKALELMIQASLAAIIFGYVRHELVLGTGIPFGALFSGLQVNQISYLWSMELWGSARSKSLSARKKLILLTLVVLVSILAATAGPSAAVLLVPRRDYWPAGSTHIWLNGNESEIWPAQLDGSIVSARCATSDEAAVSSSCPSSEWQAIDTYLRILADSIPASYYEDASGILISPAAVELTGKASLRQYYSQNFLTLDPLTNDLANITVTTATTQQSSIADALVNTAAIWFEALTYALLPGLGVSPSDAQTATHTIKENYYQPYSVARCIRDSVQTHNDSRPVAFPIAELTVFNPVSDSLMNMTHYIDGVPVLDYTPLQRSQLLKNEGSDLDYRTSWYELPPDYFNFTSVGVIVLLPQQYNRAMDDTSHGFLACNLAAGWGSSSINATWSHIGISATSSLVNFDNSRFFDPLLKFGGEQLDGTRYQNTVDVVLNYHLPVFPQAVINIRESWAKYLDPQIPDLNTTVIDYMMKVNTHNRTAAQPEILAQYLLAGLLTNGLARVGAGYELQGSPRLANSGPNGTTVFDGTYWVAGKGDFFTVDPEQSKDWVKLQVVSTIQGYAYNTRGAGPKAAIAFLLSYCALALSYTVYTGVSGKSSTAWDSIAEVTALAMNSARTKSLQNTCGGISEAQTFKTPVRVLVRSDEGEGEGEHLELVFGDNLEEQCGGNWEKDVIKANRAYGATPDSWLEKKCG